MTAPPALRIVADLPAIYAVLMRLETGERASRHLDADVFEALGWHVLRDRHLVLSPLSRAPLPLPRASRRIDCAALVLPAGWDWGAGTRGGRAAAWCRSPHTEGHPDLLWFEVTCPARPMPDQPAPGVPALALLRAALHAQRALLLRASDDGLAPALPAGRWACDGCGWVGPQDAARGGACPDCHRQIHEAAA